MEDKTYSIIPAQPGFRAVYYLVGCRVNVSVLSILLLGE